MHAKVIDRTLVEEVKWAYGTESTTENKERMHNQVADYSSHFASTMHDLGKHSTL